ncbi:MAG: sensor histidine kinase [bacterium]|nr:sensor histidine kinase [bacterium]
MLTRIWHKAALYFSLVSTLPVAVLFYLTLERSEDVAAREVAEKHQELASYAMQEVDRLLYARKIDVENLALRQEIKDATFSGDGEIVQGLLKNVKIDYGTYSSIHLIKPSGEIISSSESKLIGRSVANEDWFKKAVEAMQYSSLDGRTRTRTVRAYVSDLRYDSLSASYGLSIVSPVRMSEKDEAKAFLVSRLNWSELYSVIHSVPVQDGEQTDLAYAVLLDSEGRIIAGPGELLTGNSAPDKVIFQRNLLKEGWRSVEAALNGRAGSLEEDFSKDGRSYIVGYKGSTGYLDFRGLGWATVVVEDYQAAVDEISNMRRGGVVVIVLLGVSAIMVAFIFSRGLTERLSRLKYAMQALRLGSFSQQLAFGGRDEFGEIVDDFNEMSRVIGERVLSEETRRRRAEHSELAKSAFLGDISHELRGPLNSILDISDVLLDSSLSSQQMKFATSIRRSTCSLLAMANDLRDIARIESGQGFVSTSQFQITDVVEEVLAVLYIAARAQGVELCSYFSSDVPKVVGADPVRLHQVLNNLMSYAIKIVRGKELLLAVHVVTRPDGQIDLRFIVEENGVGVNTAAMDYLFEKQDLAEPENSTQDLGGELSTTRRMVELMGGELGGFSGHEHGTVFWVHVPISVIETQVITFPERNYLVLTQGAVFGRILATYLGRGSKKVSCTHRAEEAKRLLGASRETLSVLVESSFLAGSGMTLAELSDQVKPHGGSVILFCEWNEEISSLDSEGNITILEKPLRVERLQEALQFPG